MPPVDSPWSALRGAPGMRLDQKSPVSTLVTEKPRMPTSFFLLPLLREGTWLRFDVPRATKGTSQTIRPSRIAGLKKLLLKSFFKLI